MGLSRFELLTPRLSSVCSNQLSYRPDNRLQSDCHRAKAEILSKLDRTCAHHRVQTRRAFAATFVRPGAKTRSIIFKFIAPAAQPSA